MGMEDLSPTETQLEFARTAARCAVDCDGKATAARESLISALLESWQ